MVDKTLCMSNKKSDKRKREKENSKKKKTPRVDADLDTFVTMQKESVLHHDASLREQQHHNMAMEKVEEDKMKWTTMSHQLEYRTKLLEAYKKLKDDPLMMKEKICRLYPEMEEFFSDEGLCNRMYFLCIHIHVINVVLQLCASVIIQP